MEKRIATVLLTLFIFGCGAPEIMRFAEESYKLNPSIHIKDKLALFPMISAGSSSFSSSAGMPKISESPYSPSRVIDDSEFVVPGEAAMEGFRHQANDILLAKLKNRFDTAIIPPQQVSGIINQMDMVVPYMDFLRDYNYLGANPDFLKELGDYLGCKYLVTTQLVVVSTVKDSSVSFVWTFAKRSSDYSVTILGQIWDLSAGKLVWTGRGTSSTVLGVYEKLPYFDELAAQASEELINILP